jgi:hypothetical protein
MTAQPERELAAEPAPIIDFTRERLLRIKPSDIEAEATRLQAIADELWEDYKRKHRALFTIIK